MKHRDLRSLVFAASIASLQVVPSAFVFSGFVVGGPNVAFAQTADAAAANASVKTTIEEIRATIAREKSTLSETALQKKIEAALRPLFDFPEMAKSSLGANWSKATPEEQKTFVELFTELLAQSYLKKIRENIELSEILFLEPVARDSTVVVKTTVSSKGDDFPVDYRMRLSEGRWRVYDVVIENVGLVSNYRNEFTTIVRKEQMSGLIQRLREKLATAKR